MDFQAFVDLIPREWHPESHIPEYSSSGIPYYPESGCLRYYYPMRGMPPIDPYGPGEQNSFHPVMYPRQSIDIFRQRRGRIPIYALHYGKYFLKVCLFLIINIFFIIL